MKTIEEAAPLYLEKYTYRGGMLKQNAKIDDDYECKERDVTYAAPLKASIRLIRKDKDRRSYI